MLKEVSFRGSSKEFTARTSGAKHVTRPLIQRPAATVVFVLANRKPDDSHQNLKFVDVEFKYICFSLCLWLREYLILTFLSKE